MARQPVIGQITQQTRAGGSLAIARQSGTSAVAQALSGLAGTLAGAEQVLAQRREELAQADAAKLIADTKARWTEEIARRQVEAEDGAPGYAESIAEDYKADLDGVLSQAKTERARLRMEVSLAQFGGALRADATVFETRKRTEFKVEQLGESIDVGRNVLLSSPGQFSGILTDALEAIESQDLPADERRALEDAARNGLALSAVQGQIEGGQAGATLRQLQEGQWDSYLKPERKAALMNAANREIRRQAAEARAAKRAAQIAFLDGFDDTRAFVLAGNELPPDSPYTDEAFRRMFDEDKAADLIEMRNRAVEEGGFVADIGAMSEADALAALDEFRPSATDPAGFSREAERFNRLQQFHLREMKARADDAAGYVMRNDRNVSEAFADMQAAATPEEAASAAAIYAKTVEAAYDEREIPSYQRRLMPRSVAVSTAAGIDAAAQAERSPALRTQLDMWGDRSQDALREYAEAGLSDPLYIGALYANNPVISQQLAAVAQEGGSSALKKLVDTTTAKDVRDAVQDEFAEYRAAFTFGDWTLGSHKEFGKLIGAAEAVALLHAGQGSSPTEAARAARVAFVDNTVNILQGGRVHAVVPVQFNASLVESGAEAALTAASVSKIDLMPFGSVAGLGFLDEERTRRAVIHSGQWTYTGDGRSLTLIVPTGDGSWLPALHRDGTAVTLSFVEAARQGTITSPSDVIAP